MVQMNEHIRKADEVQITELEKVPHKIGSIQLLDLTTQGKQHLIDEYKKAKARGAEFKVGGLEVIEKVTTVIR